MSQVIEALEHDHANILRLLEILESEILAIEVGKTPDYLLMQDIMRYIAQHTDRFHHPKEDLIFAQLLKREPDVRAVVDDLIDEHVIIGLAGQEFARLLRISGVDSVNVREVIGRTGFSYIQALRQHMSKEERTLFPLALAILSDEEWQVIDDAVSATADPLFDEMSADDYQRLYRLITNQPNGTVAP